MGRCSGLIQPQPAVDEEFAHAEGDDEEAFIGGVVAVFRAGAAAGDGVEGVFGGFEAEFWVVVFDGGWGFVDAEHGREDYRGVFVARVLSVAGRVVDVNSSCCAR